MSAVNQKHLVYPLEIYTYIEKLYHTHQTDRIPGTLALEHDWRLVDVCETGTDTESLSSVFRLFG